MKTFDTEFIAPELLNAWFCAARPGSVLVYAVGHLAMDRCRGGALDPINTVANIALDLEKRGQVYLFQRRLNGGDVPRWEYRIIRRRYDFATDMARAERLSTSRRDRMMQAT